MREILLELPGGPSGDQLHSLRDWLSREGELRGRIGFVESEPVPGTLSSGMVKALTVGVGSGGAITALVSGVISWLRQVAGQPRQPVPAKVSIELPNGGTVTLETALIRELTPAELSDQIDHLAGLVSEGVQAAGAAVGPSAGSRRRVTGRRR